MLLAVGLIMLSRLSMFRADPLDKALKQFVIICGAAVVSWLIPWIMERFWQIYKFQWIYAAVGILALLAVWIGGMRALERSFPLPLEEFPSSPRNL